MRNLLNLKAKFKQLCSFAESPMRPNAFVARPWRERIPFAVAVFFLFSTVGVLTIFINHTAVPMPAKFVLVTLLLSGSFAGVLVLLIGRTWLVLLWVFMFAGAMYGNGMWGSAIQKELALSSKAHALTAMNEESRIVFKEFQGRLRFAMIRDVAITLVLIVLSYIAFIQAFNHEWKKRSVVESELQVARRIQESLLPPGEQRLAGWHMCGVLYPANTVAGDYFDYLKFVDGKIGVLVADGSGHGVAAGLVMTMIKSQLFSLTAAPHEVTTFFQSLNQCVRALAPKNMFVTAGYVALAHDAAHNDAALVEFATVGHPPLLRYSAARNVVEELSTPATALGLQITLQLTPRTIMLEPNDMLLLYTDGIFEQMNPAKEQWGLERLKAALLEHRHLPLNELCARIMQRITAFRMHAATHDDMTLVAIRREV